MKRRIASSILVLGALFVSTLMTGDFYPIRGQLNIAFAQSHTSHARWTPPDPIGWRLEYSPRTTLTITSEGPSFQFPNGKANSSVNMLTKWWPGTTAGSLAVTTRIVTTGTPIFRLRQGPEPQCSNPPAARAWLATTDWTNGSLPDYEWNRWWSRDGYTVLGPGTTSIDVPLDPAGWSNVNGQLASSTPEATTHFWRVVNQGGRLGLVFGGGCSYGHGIYVTGGTAVFTILQYDVL